MFPVQDFEEEPQFLSQQTLQGTINIEHIEDLPDEFFDDNETEFESEFDKLHLKSTNRDFLDEEPNLQKNEDKPPCTDEELEKKLGKLNLGTFTEKSTDENPFQNSEDKIAQKEENSPLVLSEQKSISFEDEKPISSDTKAFNLIKNTPKTQFKPTVALSMNKKPSVKVCFLKNCENIVLQLSKKSRIVNNQRQDSFSYTCKYFSPKTAQNNEKRTWNEIKEKSENFTEKNMNPYRLEKLELPEEKISVHQNNEEILKLSFSDNLQACRQLVEKKEYALAFLLSKGNQESERLVTTNFVCENITPTFQGLFFKNSFRKVPVRTGRSF